MPVIYNKKVEYAYTDPGVKAHTLSWAEYQALSEDDKMNGDLYFIPDKQPEGNPSRIWTKLGTDPLTTQADDVSGAVNELNSSLPKYYLATAEVSCTNAASNSWGYWGYTTIDLSQVLADKTVLAIVPQLCTLRGDPAVIGLMSFTYTASNYTLIPRVNFKNSGTFSVQFLVMYR